MKQARRSPNPVRFYGYPVRPPSLWDEMRAEWRQVLGDMIVIVVCFVLIAVAVFGR